MSCSSSEVNFRHNRVLRPFEVRAVAEGEDALVQEGELPPPEADASGQTVSVPVSPSDVLTMFFQVRISLSHWFVYVVRFKCSTYVKMTILIWNAQAEGTMADAAIPTVTSALEVFFLQLFLIID